MELLPHKMAFAILENMLPADLSDDIAARLHKSYMHDVFNELPVGLGKLCPFAIAFKKSPATPLQYLKDNYDAQVYTHGHNYYAPEHDVYPYDRSSYIWSALIIRIPKTNTIMGHYWHDESGYRTRLLFTGFISLDGVVAERFYYKDGTTKAVTSKEEFMEIYKGELSGQRIFRFLADISGEVDLATDITFPNQCQSMPWFSDPHRIMTSLDHHHGNNVDAHYYDDIYD